MTQNNVKPVVSKSKWISSVREFRSTRVVVFCGMMCALAIVLNYTSTIRIGDYIRIGFSGIPNRVVDYLFGPFVGAVFGGALDIIKYFLTPTGGFFPGFTLTAMLGGVIHGYILYRRRPTLARVFAAQLLVKVLLNCGLNTLWLQMLYGQGRALWPSCRAGLYPTRSCCRWIPCSTILSCRRWTDISVPVSWRTE